MGIYQTFSCPHVHRQVQVERYHQTLARILRCIAATGKDNWLEYLDCATFAMNSAVNTATGCSPYFAMFGEDPRTPATAAFGLPAKKMSHLTEYTRKLEERFAMVYEAVRQNLKASYMRQMKQYNHRAPETLAVGQNVFYFSPVVAKGSTAKIFCHWSGPWEVKRIKGILVDIVAKGEWSKNKRL